MLEWELTTHGLPDLHVTPKSGTLDAQSLVILNAEFASAKSQARAAPYVGNITFRAVSGVCVCRPQTLTISVEIDVSADAHANNSQVSLGNADTVKAGTESLTFSVAPSDVTGMPMLDASDVQ